VRDAAKLEDFCAFPTWFSPGLLVKVLQSDLLNPLQEMFPLENFWTAFQQD
jgi:hypothetical protein